MGRLLLLLLIVTLLSAIRVAHAVESIRIGVSLGLTGTYQSPATMQLKAYRLWEQSVNERGGLLGRPVQVLIEDDNSDGETARAIYRAWLSEKQVDLIFGPYSSRVNTAVAPVADEFGYPMLTPGAAADRLWELGYENVFGMLTPASRYTVQILSMALLHDLSRVAIVHADDDFSMDAAQGAKKWAKRHRLDVVLYQAFKKGTRDLSSLADEVRRADTELLIVVGHFNESVDMRRAMAEIDWYPNAYFATIGPALPRYHTELGSDADLTFATSIWEPSQQPAYPHSHEFTQAFEQLHGVAPSYHAAAAFAAGQILERAVNKADSIEHESVRLALLELDSKSIIGRYAVDRTGMQIKRFPLIIQWQDGRKEIVWPPERRTHEPIFVEVQR